MSEYVIGQSLYQGGKLIEVTIQCLDAPEPPDYHLYEAHSIEPEDVVGLIKRGHRVMAYLTEKPVEVEVVQLEDGTESVEVVQQEPPSGRRSLADLPECET
ncbi:hypothetical protein [Polaromonas sp. LjRoot131]|uniref:hypothetical protein n=1 Tax=Polaromonas sp. LjRoot131 TaxID=3342262 RepID=UPI003ECFCE18